MASIVDASVLDGFHVADNIQLIPVRMNKIAGCVVLVQGELWLLAGCYQQDDERQEAKGISDDAKNKAPVCRPIIIFSNLGRIY